MIGHYGRAFRLLTYSQPLETSSMTDDDTEIVLYGSACTCILIYWFLRLGVAGAMHDRML